MMSDISNCQMGQILNVYAINYLTTKTHDGQSGEIQNKGEIDKSTIIVKNV